MSEGKLTRDILIGHFSEEEEWINNSPYLHTAHSGDMLKNLLACCTAKRQILEIHKEIIRNEYYDVVEYGCSSCHVEYPCPTVYALLEAYEPEGSGDA